MRRWFDWEVFCYGWCRYQTVSHLRKREIVGICECERVLFLSVGSFSLIQSTDKYKWTAELPNKCVNLNLKGEKDAKGKKTFSFGALE